MTKPPAPDRVSPVMDFRLTPEEEAMVAEVRAFASTHIRPLATRVDRHKVFPQETISMMQKKGWFGMPYPKEWGGMGLSTIAYSLSLMEVARACSSHATTWAVHTSLPLGVLNNYASPQQKKKYMVPLASGEALGSFCLTEPCCGTDVASMKTVAEVTSQGYRITGTKMFITSGNRAATYVVFAKTPHISPRAISAFIVEAHRPGISWKVLDKTGNHGSDTAFIRFNDVHVPKENLIGQEGKGFKMAMEALNSGRIGIAALCLGIAREALDAMHKRAHSRKVFSAPLASNQGVRWTIAHLETQWQAGKWLVLHAGWLKDTGQTYAREAAMAKVFCSDLAFEAASALLQLYGGHGYLAHSLPDRLYRDAKLFQIGEGANEVLKDLIFRFTTQKGD